MRTSEEHSRHAEGYLRCGDVARAQVHATLAQAAASRDQARAMQWAVAVWELCSRPGRILMGMFSLVAAIRHGKTETWEENSAASA